jgi:hypothetical protein
MEPLLFIVLHHSMDIFGWGSLTSPSLKGLCLMLGGLLTSACLVDHPLVALLIDVENIFSLWWFGIYAYLGYG